MLNVFGVGCFLAFAVVPIIHTSFWANESYSLSERVSRVTSSARGILAIVPRSVFVWRCEVNVISLPDTLSLKAPLGG